MDRGEFRIGRDGHQHGGFEFGAIGPHPVLPQARQREEALVGGLHEERHLAAFRP